MKRTFQTNEEREQYYNKLSDLHQKYASLTSAANEALANPWDSKKEIMKMAKDKKAQRGSSLMESKKTFKRNRKADKMILNERSGGDLFSVSESSAQLLTP